MKGYLCAGIRMLDTPYHVDVVYDYLIPPELEEALSDYFTILFTKNKETD